MDAGLSGGPAVFWSAFPVVSGQAVGCRGASGLLCSLVVLWTASSGVIGLGLLVSNPDGECLGHGAPGLVF